MNIKFWKRNKKKSKLKNPYLLNMDKGDRMMVIYPYELKEKYRFAGIYKQIQNNPILIEGKSDLQIIKEFLKEEERLETINEIFEINWQKYKKSFIIFQTLKY